VLTEAGHLALSYGDEIFCIGRELMNALKHRPGTRPLRVNVGLTDSFPKLIAFEILKAAFRQGEAIHLVCREGELAEGVHQLQAHRLDIVLANEPASSVLKAKTFNHRARLLAALCGQLTASFRRRSFIPKSQVLTARNPQSTAPIDATTSTASSAGPIFSAMMMFAPSIAKFYRCADAMTKIHIR